MMLSKKLRRDQTKVGTFKTEVSFAKTPELQLESYLTWRNLVIATHRGRYRAETCNKRRAGKN